MIKTYLYRMAILAFAFLAFACQKDNNVEDESKTEETTTPQEKYVTLNGTLTETVAAFGMEEQIVGVDVTSTYPASIQKVPKVGHTRNLQAEGILSLNPTVVIGLKDEIKPEIQQKLEAAGVKVKLFEQEYSFEGTKQLITEMGEYFGKKEKAQEIIQAIESDVNQIKTIENPPSVLFIYARGAGTLMVAGENTQMKSFIELAGGKNAVEGFEDFKPLTPEALLQSNPDVVLLFSSGLESLEGENGLLEVPGMKDTNAGKNKRFIAMNGAYISGFGPRLGKALLDFNQKLTAETNEL